PRNPTRYISPYQRIASGPMDKAMGSMSGAVSMRESQGDDEVAMCTRGWCLSRSRRRASIIVPDVDAVRSPAPWDGCCDIDDNVMAAGIDRTLEYPDPFTRCQGVQKCPDSRGPPSSPHCSPCP